MSANSVCGCAFGERLQGKGRHISAGKRALIVLQIEHYINTLTFTFFLYVQNVYQALCKLKLSTGTKLDNINPAL